MSKKIIGVTVGTPLSTQFIKEKINPVTSVDGIKADENGNVNLVGYATEKHVKEYAQPKGNYLTEHQDISGKLDADKLPDAIDAALAQAKESGEFDGKDGYTPVKGIDYFDGKDGQDGYTPVKGVDYFDGSPGQNGKPGQDGYTPVKGVDYFDGVPGKDGISTTHSWNGTVLTITSASGTSSENLKGEKGDAGEQGIPGTPGSPGKSAYEYAKDAGYEGTEEEFADKLANGPDGDDFIPKTQEDISVNGVTGLGIADNATIPAGTSLTDLVKMLVQKPIPATYTKPTVSLANNGGQASGNVEAGTSITPKLKATFAKNDAGNLSKIVIKQGSTEVANGTASPLTYSGQAITIGDSSVTFTASATYAAAPVKNNNLGQVSTENWFDGGTVSSGNYTITGKRNLFYGTGTGAVPTVTSDFVRGLSNTKLAPVANTTFTINVAVGQQYIAFAYPSDLRDVNNVTYVEANDSGMASNFAKTTINVADARGGTNGLKEYKIYTYAMAVPAAATMTFNIKI